MSDDLKKEVTVVCGTSRRMVKVNFENYEETLDAIRRKWRFSEETQFQLQVYCGKKGTYYDIVDVDDLKHFKDTEEIHVIVQVSPVEPEVQTSVVLSGGNYSITKAPEAESMIVKNHISKLKDILNFEELKSAMELIVDCLRTAFYAATAWRLRIEYVTDLQFDCHQLCLDLDQVMILTQRMTEKALSNLHGGFRHMLDGFEEVGVRRIGSIEKNWEQIINAFETITKQMDDANAKHFGQLEIDKRIESLKLEQKKAENAERRYLESDSWFGFGLKKLLTLGYYQGSTQLAAKEKHNAWEAKEKLKEQEELKKTEKIPENNILRACAIKLAETKDDHEEQTEEAIAGVLVARDMLNVNLAGMVDFCKRSQNEFKITGNADELKQLGKRGVTKEMRRKFWTGDVFKEQAILCSARFVAIQCMCTDIRKIIKDMQHSLQGVISDKPTKAQAQEKLPSLISILLRKTDRSTGTADCD